MKNKYASHDINLDIIRCFAVISVFQLHFFLNTNFYAVTVEPPFTFAMCVMATAFRSCVPLFLLLTGYLMSGKKLSAQFYGGLIRVLLTYAVTSVVFIMLLHYTGEADYTFKTAFLDITAFCGSNYAWYVQMYCGLFLMIPFFNILWERLDTRNKRLALTVTLAVLTLLPKVLNSFNFRTPGWFAHPYLDRGYDPLIPDWWSNFYPVTYYFIGSYIRKENVTMKKWLNLLLVLLSVGVFGYINFYRSRGGVFTGGAPVDWGSLGMTTISVLGFIFLRNIKFTSKLPQAVKYVISRISYLSLTMYLFSAYADRLAYKALLRTTGEPELMLSLFPVVTATVFLISLIMSEITDRAAISPLTKLCNRLYGKIIAACEARKKNTEAEKEDLLAVLPK